MMNKKIKENKAKSKIKSKPQQGGRSKRSEPNQTAFKRTLDVIVENKYKILSCAGIIADIVHKFL